MRALLALEAEAPAEGYATALRPGLADPRAVCEGDPFPHAATNEAAPVARALRIPNPALSPLVGAVCPGEVLLLQGAPDLLSVCAHAFLVEAVRERGAPGDTLQRDPRAVVVDGGNCVSPYLFAAIARGQGQDAELLTARVRLSRAFTAYQFVALLTDALDAELSRVPCDLLAVLAARELFEDQDLGASEARQLARHACGGLRSLAARHGLPCVVTSPSPSSEPRALALERIVVESASRAVGGLRFPSVPGAKAPKPGLTAAFEGVEGRVASGQRALDAWGPMPPRGPLVGPPRGHVEGGILIRAHWRPERGRARL